MAILDNDNSQPQSYGGTQQNIGFPPYQEIQQQPQPIYQQQPVYQQQPLPIYQQQQQPQLQHVSMTPMSKMKIKHNTDCIGNYTNYQTNFPQELMGLMSGEEYQDLIEQFNKISYWNRKPIIICVIIQLILIIPMIICSTNNNIPGLVTFLIFIIMIPIFIFGYSIYLIKKISNNMEKKIKQVNLDYAPRKIHFEMKRKIVSKSGKRYHIKLVLHYPLIGFYVIPQQIIPQQIIPQQIIQPQVYYNNNNAILQQQQQQQQLPIDYQYQIGSQQFNNNNDDKVQLLL